MSPGWSTELPAHPPCPHCGSRETELLSAFGSVLANAQYHCHGCRTPFEQVKWQPENP